MSSDEDRELGQAYRELVAAVPADWDVSLGIVHVGAKRYHRATASCANDTRVAHGETPAAAAQALTAHFRAEHK